jgi:6-phosphogluconolactonase (cycloisomerase 2 family)
MLVFSLMLAVALAMLPASLAAGNFVFTNNEGSPNTVTVFRVAPTTDALDKVGDFSTHGDGCEGLFAANRIVLSPNGNYVFAANDNDSNIAVLRVDKATGELTFIDTYSTGSNDCDHASNGASMSITPNGKFLYVGNAGSFNLTTFSVAEDGALNSLGLTSLPGAADGVEVAPNGKFLAVALAGVNKVAMVSIGKTGALTTVSGSPFAAAYAGLASGVSFKCNSKFLFTGQANGTQTAVDVFSVAKDGSLTEIFGGPFTFFDNEAVNSNVVLYKPFGQLLFVSNQESNTVVDFKVDSQGLLAAGPNSPVSTGSGGIPSGMASNSVGNSDSHKTGHLLYVASDDGTVAVFTVATDGTLTAVTGSPFPTGASGFLESLAVWPGGGCK